MRMDLQDIEKIFDEQTLFSIEHFVFETGKTYGLIGHNGMGKTTLLRMLGGFDPDFYGRVTYDGQSYSSHVTKRLSYITQEPYMLNRSVQENLAYPLQIRKTDRTIVDSKVNEWVHKLDLTPLADRKAIVLSAGEQQKVALARGLIYQPELIFLDEPTANIDPDTVSVLEQIVRAYQLETKATIIWVTHNLDQAFRICDEVVVMKKDGLHTIEKEALKERLDTIRHLEYFLDDNKEEGLA